MLTAVKENKMPANLITVIPVMIHFVLLPDIRTVNNMRA